MSKKEAKYAERLDLMMKALDPKDRVVKWTPQVTFKLEVNGQLITKYILDFLVEYADGRIEHIDVKGRKSGAPYTMFKLKKKLMKALLGIEVIEV